jgi:protein-S-isoprenylcysteine O-methyltransferase Ste14
MKFAVQTLLSSLFGLVFFGLSLFLPAWTLHYWQGWTFIAVFMTSTFIPSVYLAVKDPAALQRRMKAGPLNETRPAQRAIMVGVIASVVLMLVVSALDHRFGWSSVPLWLTVTGYVLVAAGLNVAQFVVIQNSYAAATITVEADQKLVSTGLYGIVRHPMYLGTIIMMLGTPPALDSLWGLAVLVPTLLLLAARISDEEKMLTLDLPGYREYIAKVPNRLLPYVW